MGGISVRTLEIEGFGSSLCSLSCQEIVTPEGPCTFMSREMDIFTEVSPHVTNS